MCSAKDSEMVSTNLKNFVTSGKKIIGAGLNYRSILTWKNLPTPDKPAIFFKPTTSYIVEGDDILLPTKCVDVQEEVELGVIIGKKGRYIKEEDVDSHIAGYCLALDMTDVGFLGECKKKGLPWAVGKGFDTACPVSRFVSKKELPDPQNIRIYCKLNSKYIQDSSTSDMFFTIPKLISYISEFITLEPYDLILTGSPAGSTSVKSGDHLECGLGNILTMNFYVRK